MGWWALAGEWTIGKQATVLGSPRGRIAHRFHARDVHLVMGPSRQQSEVRFRVSLDGRRRGAARGLDVNEDRDDRSQSRGCISWSASPGQSPIER